MFYTIKTFFGRIRNMAQKKANKAKEKSAKANHNVKKDATKKSAKIKVYKAMAETPCDIRERDYLPPCNYSASRIMPRINKLVATKNIYQAGSNIHHAFKALEQKGFVLDMKTIMAYRKELIVNDCTAPMDKIACQKAPTESLLDRLHRAKEEAFQLAGYYKQSDIEKVKKFYARKMH